MELLAQEAHTREHLLGLGLHRVAAEMLVAVVKVGELLGELRVGVGFVVRAFGELVGDALHLAFHILDFGEGGDGLVPHGERGVAGEFLRQVAHAVPGGDDHRAGGGLQVAVDDLEQLRDEVSEEAARQRAHDEGAHAAVAHQGHHVLHRRAVGLRLFNDHQRQKDHHHAHAVHSQGEFDVHRFIPGDRRLEQHFARVAGTTQMQEQVHQVERKSHQHCGASDCNRTNGGDALVVGQGQPSKCEHSHYHEIDEYVVKYHHSLSFINKFTKE